MPWKVSDVMEERFRLIERWKESPESITELAKRFGVSRKTAYKWLQRYELSGLEGLQDHSRRPVVQANRTSPEIEDWIVDLRLTHPNWGPKKLKQWLERRQQDHEWPARSTIGLILARRGLSGKRKSKRRATPSTQPLAHAREPNQVWSIDFKGWFRCGGRRRCDPLTVSDAATRYLLCCRGLDGANTAAVQSELERVFRCYGLPERMRSDNGSPFASTGMGGLTRLSVWWIKLGILPERIEPGKPQQNGRHERMHRTLKQETATPPAASLAAQQRRFDEFLGEYNQQRPHEALEGDTPADHYHRSPREFPEQLPEIEYPDGFHLRLADEGGKIRWKQARCYMGRALRHEVVGFQEVDDGVWRVWFGRVQLGLLDERKGYRPGKDRLCSRWPPLQSPSGLLARQPATDDDGKDPNKV